MMKRLLKWAVVPLSVTLSVGYLAAKTPDDELLKKEGELD